MCTGYLSLTSALEPLHVHTHVSQAIEDYSFNAIHSKRSSFSSSSTPSTLLIWGHTARNLAHVRHNLGEIKMGDEGEVGAGTGTGRNTTTILPSEDIGIAVIQSVTRRRKSTCIQHPP